MDDQQEIVIQEPEPKFTSDYWDLGANLAIGTGGACTAFWWLLLTPLFSGLWFVLVFGGLFSAGYAVKEVLDEFGVEYKDWMKREPRVKLEDDTDNL